MTKCWGSEGVLRVGFFMMDMNRGRWAFGVYTIRKTDFYMGLGRGVCCVL